MVMNTGGCVSQHCDAVTAEWRQSTEKGKMFILAHSFRGSSPWSQGPIVLGPVGRWHIMAGTHGRGS
jgi:hypothetical protein